MESYADLRAAKLTCLLSRAEPRDLDELLALVDAIRGGRARERKIAVAELEARLS